LKTYALIALNKNNSSEIFFGQFEKMPTLKQANKELKLRDMVGQVIAVVESVYKAEIQYQSMAWSLSAKEGSKAL
jgi:hypothetical protein